MCKVARIILATALAMCAVTVSIGGAVAVANGRMEDIEALALFLIAMMQGALALIAALEPPPAKETKGIPDRPQGVTAERPKE